MISNATIIHNDNPTRIAHAFPTRTGCAAPCFTRVFSDARTVSGIGDITLRAKATAWKGERAGLAIGVDVRTPTGDALNFLGAGAAGVKPFLIWSYRQRISPHAVVGYEVNGSSVIAGDISTGTKERLPGQLTFTGGADVWINRSLTVVFDVVGQRVFESRRSSTTTFVGPGACDSISCNNPGPDYTATDLTQYTATHSVMNGSVGFKVKPTSTLLITGHVLLKLNDNGLRTGAIPMTALSYTF
jgi:hypothetical protein